MNPDGPTDSGGPFPCSTCGGEHDTLAELWACKPTTDDALFDVGDAEGLGQYGPSDDTTPGGER